ncbi:MAG: tRNA pseudouridine(38-40) synthase TruA [Hormoscilla sp. SP12CHS1]|nr:tRNA pseudouridine(38-40) synthase TruA [Hormoscilla sp. SP12CHS1]
MDKVQSTPDKQRVALVIQYLGTRFHGWQRQGRGERTVQSEIETAIFTVLKRPVPVIAAGRTDAGVHAAGQVAHFEATGKIPASRWATVLNERLPKDILILTSVAVPDTWHARFSASMRRYRYTIYTDKQANLFVRPFAWHYYYQPLDASLIQEALSPLIGKHHLAAFRKAGADRKHSWVEVQGASCGRSGPFIYIEVQANGFLYGMMRLLVGLLVSVGDKGRSVSEFTQIWKAERRDLVKYAAPPQGLCLLRVGYPDSPFRSEVWENSQPKLVLSPNYSSSRRH